MEAAIQKAADELVEKFEEQWKPAMENLQEADMAFDDLEGAPSLRMPRGQLSTPTSMWQTCRGHSV